MKSKVLTVLLSVLIAFTLWAYVITVEQPESEETFYNIPVILDGGTVLSERGLMITSDTDLTVNLKLSGNRTELNKLRSSDIIVRADLTRIYEAGKKSLPYTVDVQNNAIEVVSREPNSIELTVVEWASKEIPVVVEFQGNVPQDYVADKQDVVLSHTAITIAGPREVVDQIHQAQILMDLEGRKETFAAVYTPTLCDEQGNAIEDVSTITVSNDEIHATISIQKVQDVQLTYQVIPGGGLTAADVTVSLEYQTITVAGSTAALEGLTQIMLGTIDLGTLTENAVLTFPVTLPEGVANLSGINTVTVTVTLPEMEIRSYTATNFRQENLPAGKKAQILAQKLDVRIRGMGPVLDDLKPENIVVVVDFTDAENGRAKYNATVEIIGMEDAEVGAVGVYYIFADISDAAASGTGTQGAEIPEAQA